MIFRSECAIFNSSDGLGIQTGGVKEAGIFRNVNVMIVDDKAVKTLHGVELDIKGVPNHEVGVVVDRSSGIEIYRKTGLGDRVEIPSELVKDNIFTHNHPNGGCMLSYSDVANTVRADGYEVRVVTSDGRFVSLKRGSAAWDKELLFGLDLVYCGGNESQFYDRVERLAHIKHGKGATVSQILQEAEDLINGWIRNNAKRYGCIFTEGAV